MTPAAEPKSSRTTAPCPSCGRAHDAHAGVDTNESPAAGDLSLCWGCREPAFFTETGLRVATPEERAEVLADPDVRAALAAMAESYTPLEAQALARRTAN